LSPDKHGRLVMGPTKPRRARYVPIIPQMRAVLDKAMVGKARTDLIFTGPRGGALDSSNLARSIGLTDWRDEVKVYPPGDDPMHLHDHRHTAITIMADGGATVLDSKAVPGHSTVKMTEHYARPGIAAARRVGESYSAALSSYAPKGKRERCPRTRKPPPQQRFCWVARTGVDPAHLRCSDSRVNE